MEYKKKHKNKRWYKEYHQKRRNHRLHAIMLVIFSISIVLSSLYMIFSVKPKDAWAFTNYTWDMGTPAEYTYDPGEIEFTGGVAQRLGVYSFLNVNGDISCTDVSTCYIAGYDGVNGKIFKTTNGGADWVEQHSGIDYLYTVDFPTVSIGYAAGNDKIFKTTNGGADWVDTGFTPDGLILSISCADIDICYGAGFHSTSNKSAIYRTINGGATWDITDFDSGVMLGGASAISGSSTGYVVGNIVNGNGKILKTIDSGNSWTPQTSGVAMSLSEVDCTDINTCYIVGNTGTILKTANGGDSWTPQVSGTTEYLTNIHFPTANVGYAVGLNGTLLKTINGGTEWIVLQNVVYDSYDISCLNNDICYTSGTQANFKTINAGSDWERINYYPTPTIMPSTSRDYNIITGFSETLASDSTGDIYYQVSNNDGATWYWYDGLAWSVAYDNHYWNTVSEINSNIPTFLGSYGSGTGKFKWKAIFHATGTSQQQKIDSIQVAIKDNSPNRPQSLTVADVSNRNKSVWALALSWDALDPGGSEIDYYTIERSDNGGPWTEVGKTSSGTNRAYAEVVPDSSVTYSYRVRSVDFDDVGGVYEDKSDPSNIVSMMPTGKYSSPPSLLGVPSVSVTATTAVITWSTERTSSSTVKYGIDTSYSAVASSPQNEVTSHSVSLKGLIPGITYHFKIQSLDSERTYGDDAYYSDDYTFVTSQSTGISGVKATEVIANSALISWQTTSDISLNINYGKTTDYGSTAKSGGGTSHSVRLNGLEDSSVYHFKLTGLDTDGGFIRSEDHSFETLAFPRLSNIKFESIKDKPTSTLKIIWNTNIPTSSVIEYTDPEGTTRLVSEYQLVTDHEIVLSELKDNTDYILIAKGRDAFGNEASSGRQKITTEIDTRPPEISEITTETSINGYGSSTRAQMIVSWSTDELATSQVEYSKGGSGEDFVNLTQEDFALSTSHAVVISDLKPSSSYYFRVITKDGAGNEAKSEIKSGLTSKARMSIFDIMVKSFDSTLGWLFGLGRF